MRRGMIGAAVALEAIASLISHETQKAQERSNYRRRSLFDPRYEDRSMAEINLRLKELAGEILEALPRAARKFHDEENPRMDDVLYSFRYAAEYPLRGEGDSDEAKAEYWEMTQKYMMGYYDLHRFFESRIADEVGVYISPYYEQELYDLANGGITVKRNGITYRGAEGDLEETRDAYASNLFRVQRRDLARAVRKCITMREARKAYYGFICSEGRRLLAEASWLEPYELEWMAEHYEEIDALCKLEREFYKEEEHLFESYERKVHTLLRKEILRGG